MKKTRRGRRCPYCNGTGKLVQVDWTAMPPEIVSRGRCDRCRGTGRLEVG